MDTYIGMQDFKRSNQRKTILLFILFPILLFLIIWIAFLIGNKGYVGENSLLYDSFYSALGVFGIVMPVVIIWGLISFFLQKDIMFKLSGAKAISRKENPEIYNIVENLCISRGLPVPQIAIMDEPGMNAFATGWKPKDSRICFTSGLLKNLNKREIEAVAGHELTHIINKDSLLMYVAVVFIGCVSIAGEFILRGFVPFNRHGQSSSSSKKSGKSEIIIFIIGLLLIVLGYLVYPLVKLAISRKREYLADFGSVDLTKDSQSMISALRKISKNSGVVQSNDKISAFFIANPKNYIILDLKNDNQLQGHFGNTDKKERTSIRDSHPSIDDRIMRLEQAFGA